ncbi:MAG: VOC family protein [Anaerolineales bacterium]|jgi:hypothetical protein
MDYETYRQKFFVSPPPKAQFEMSGLYGTTLFYQDYEPALAFYRQVFGPPAYVEGDSTHGWQIGDTWLTLLRGRQGNPVNVELSLVMPSAQEAERLQQAFIAAGGAGPAPSNALMYAPIRACPVTDPFGVTWMIFSRRAEPDAEY